MKISAQEEYGLRILLRIAKAPEPSGVAISEISNSEGLTTHNVAKLCRILRLGGFINSHRGKDGGYFLAKPAQEIVIGNVLTTLGGRLFGDSFCENHRGLNQFCNNSIDCTIRSLWSILQNSIDEIVDNLTLADLIGPAPKLTPLTTQIPVKA